jgi:hypothetical protein
LSELLSRSIAVMASSFQETSPRRCWYESEFFNSVLFKNSILLVGLAQDTAMRTALDPFSFLFTCIAGAAVQTKAAALEAAFYETYQPQEMPVETATAFPSSTKPRNLSLTVSQRCSPVAHISMPWMNSSSGIAPNRCSHSTAASSSVIHNDVGGEIDGDVRFDGIQKLAEFLRAMAPL